METQIGETKERKSTGTRPNNHHHLSLLHSEVEYAMLPFDVANNMLFFRLKRFTMLIDQKNLICCIIYQYSGYEFVKKFKVCL